MERARQYARLPIRDVTACDGAATRRASDPYDSALETGDRAACT